MSVHALPEQHVHSAEVVRDIVIGMADGLTVPFALAAGVSSAGASTSIVVAAGLAEIAAGAIAMGIGGYLAARSDIEHYDKEYRREFDETEKLPGQERLEVANIFNEYGLSGPLLDQVVEHIATDRKRWVDFMMRFELGLERPDARRAPISALTIALSYVIGGIVPLLPYMLVPDISRALVWSAGSTLLALFVFGGLKARFVGGRQFAGALQMMLTGGAAAGVAFLLARAVSHA